MRLNALGKVIVWVLIVAGLYALWAYMPARYHHFESPRLHIKVSTAGWAS